jgi:hypothetical protein
MRSTSSGYIAIRKSELSRFYDTVLQRYVLSRRSKLKDRSAVAVVTGHASFRWQRRTTWGIITFTWESPIHRIIFTDFRQSSLGCRRFSILYSCDCRRTRSRSSSNWLQILIKSCSSIFSLFHAEHSRLSTDVRSGIALSVTQAVWVDTAQSNTWK